MPTALGYNDKCGSSIEANAATAMTDRIYLDWNATAPLRPQARDAMLAALDAAGNPSSVHAEGRAARRLVEEAREQVAALVGAEPRNVVFTSGGTEANMLALDAGHDGRCSAATGCWSRPSSIPRCWQAAGFRPRPSRGCR